jgi:hypothetical protein
MMGPSTAKRVLREHGVDARAYLDSDVATQRVIVSAMLNRDVKGLYWRNEFARAAQNILEEDARKPKRRKS